MAWQSVDSCGLTFELSRLRQRVAARGQGRISEAGLARVGQTAVAGRLE
jgi:hypothetical protein